MTAVTQDFLREKLSDRLVASGHPPLAAGDTAPALAPDATGDLCAHLLIKQFDPTTYVRSTLAYLDALAPEILERWYHSFTRTLFLAGNPAHLSARFELHRVSPDGALAWTLPRPRGSRDALVLLLQRLCTGRPAALPARLRIEPDSAATVSRAPRTVRVCVAAKGLHLEEYLIHLNHTLCESYIQGLLHTSDRMEIEHVDDIREVPPSARYFRVQRAPAPPERFRLYAYLAT